MAKLTEEGAARLERLRQRGWSYASIGREVGLSASAVHYQCLIRGLVSPNQRGKTGCKGPAEMTYRDGRQMRRFTPEDETRMLELEAQGLSVGQIAKAMGRAQTSVRIKLLMLAHRQEVLAEAAAA